MIKSLAVTFTLLASPILAGERVENESYSLPNIANPAVFVVCETEEAMGDLLDNLAAFIQMYQTTRMNPPGCSVFVPPIPIGEHSLEYLWVTDDNKLFGVIKLPTPERDFWTYIDGGIMQKGKEGTF